MSRRAEGVGSCGNGMIYVGKKTLTGAFSEPPAIARQISPKEVLYNAV